MDTTSAFKIASLKSKEELNHGECEQILHVIGFAPQEASVVARLALGESKTVNIYDLIYKVNRVIVAKSTSGDTTSLGTMFRDDVLDKTHPTAAVNMQSGYNDAHVNRPLRLHGESLHKFSIQWQRYASSKLAMDFTSLGSAFDRYFRSIDLPWWLWRKACLEPTPSEEEIVHYCTWNLPPGIMKMHWLIDGAHYEVEFQGSLMQTADSQHTDVASPQFLLPHYLSFNWACPKQHRLANEVQAESLEDLGQAVAKRLNLPLTHHPLTASSLRIGTRNPEATTGLFTAFPNVVFHYVTQLIRTVPGVTSVKWIDSARHWQVTYAGDKPHDLLAKSSISMLLVKQPT